MTVPFKVYAVYEEEDKTEGMGGSKVIGYFVQRGHAEDAAKGLGVMGGPGRIEDVWALRAYCRGEMWLLDRNHKDLQPVRFSEDITEWKKNRALEKLTLDERQLLGLSSVPVGPLAPARSRRDE